MSRAALATYGMHLPKELLSSAEACTARVAELERENAELRRRLAQAEAQNRAVMQVIGAPHLTAGEKLTAIVVAMDTHARRANGDIDPDHGDVKINLTHYAERTGQSVNSVQRQVETLACSGWARKRTTRKLVMADDPKTGRPRPIPANVLYLQPPEGTPDEMLQAVAAVAPARTPAAGKQGDGRHGGKREIPICPDCGDVGSETYCKGCGTLLAEHQPVETPAASSHQDGARIDTANNAGGAEAMAAPTDPQPEADTTWHQDGVVNHGTGKSLSHHDGARTEPPESETLRYSSPLAVWPYSHIGQSVQTTFGRGRLAKVLGDQVGVILDHDPNRLEFFPLAEIEAAADDTPTGMMELRHAGD
jgi:hypothetical protein